MPSCMASRPPPTGRNQPSTCGVLRVGISPGGAGPEPQPSLSRWAGDALVPHLVEAGARDDAASSPEASALARERQEIVLQAVNALPENDRLAVTCRYFLDLSEAEMAAVLGCARGTVKSRLSRALGRLRAS